MAVITILSFSNINISIRMWIEYSGFFIVSIIILFPLLFLIQGMVCAINETGIINIVLSLIVSVSAYVILMYVYLNYSAGAYIIFYSAMWAAGYASVLIVKKIRALFQ